MWLLLRKGFLHCKIEFQNVDARLAEDTKAARRRILLHERFDLIGEVRKRRGMTVIIGLMVYGFESLTTIGNHGVGGDLLFATAGVFWATFGILLRTWRVSGVRAIAAVGALSILVFAPLYGVLTGYDGLLRMSPAENLLQVAVQGVIAGALPIFLFARTVILLGAGRAAVFPALVPGFGLIIGYLALGVVPTLAQLIGLVIVVVGFRFALR